MGVHLITRNKLIEIELIDWLCKFRFSVLLLFWATLVGRPVFAIPSVRSSVRPFITHFKMFNKCQTGASKDIKCLINVETLIVLENKYLFLLLWWLIWVVCYIHHIIYFCEIPGDCHYSSIPNYMGRLLAKGGGGRLIKGFKTSKWGSYKLGGGRFGEQIYKIYHEMLKK